MSREQKTGRKHRNTYIYYNADGSIAAELIPGTDGVTEELIAVLHESDDLVFLANRRENYGAPVHYDNYTNGDDGNAAAADVNPYLADAEEDPAYILTSCEEQALYEERLRRLRSLIETFTPEQTAAYEARYLHEKTNVSIAADLGITETAVRKRQKKFLSQIKNILKEWFE